MDAFYVPFWSFVAGFLGGMISSIGLRFGSSRRITRLEWAMGDVQERLATLHGKKASMSRWEKEQADKLEMAQILRQPVATSRKYDNDPLGSL
jgi:hypothetical protein